MKDRIELRNNFHLNSNIEIHKSEEQRNYWISTIDLNSNIEIHKFGLIQ